MCRINCILFSTFTLIIFHAQASHIVGGEIQYKFLGGTKYRLTFLIYRDCSSTTRFDGDYINNPDNKFYFGIFQGTETINTFPAEFRSISLKSKRTLNSVIVHSCLQPNNSCVEEGVYETEIDLPRNDIGYTIIHQRCCRNDAILNIKPLEGDDNTMPGFTIKCFIPPIVAYANNSPVFKKFPPIFICRDQPFYFDHGAIDNDGDSLSYFLTTPLDGLTAMEPLSSNQSLVPVKGVRWQSSYSLSNVLGGNPALSIDSNTGFMSCRPNLNGRFVVSVIVVEYRNGLPIDTLNRDFQFNVVNCDIPKADMPFLPGTMDPNTGMAAYMYNFCDTFLVKFKNTSSNSTHYRWDFGDPASGLLNTSKEFEPTHTFTDTGIFLVKLWAYKVRITGDTCKDSTSRYVRVFPKFRVLFTGHNACPDSPVSFTDLTTSYYGVTQKWQWNFGDGQSSTQQNPKHVYLKSGNYKVSLIATDSKYCVEDTNFQITIFQRPVFKDSIIWFCIGEEKTIHANEFINSLDSIYSYKWSAFNNEGNGSKFTYRMTKDTTVNVKLIVVTDKGCRFEKNIQLKTYPKPNPPLLLDSYFVKCNETLLCGIGDPYAIKYKWHDGVRDSVRYLNERGWYKVTITYPCEEHIDSFRIYLNYLRSDFLYEDKCINDTYHFINTCQTWLTTPLKYKWEIGTEIYTSFHLSYKFKDTKTYPVKLIVFDSFGCSDTVVKMPQAYPLPEIRLPFEKFCKGVSNLLKPVINYKTPARSASYLWTLNDSIVGKDSTLLYTLTGDETKKISLIVRNDNGCIDSSYKWVRAHSKPYPIKLKDSYFIQCADSFLVDISDSLALNYLWRDNYLGSKRMINFPEKFFYTIQYPCEVYKDSFKVHNSCTIEVPRAFTPNGDGNNDRLYIRGYAIKELISFKIYNRQGTLLYFSNNQEEGWDGYYKGQAQNSETYFYTYEAKIHANGTRASGEGHFLLLR